MTIAVVGRGAVGSTLSRALQAAGANVVHLRGRDLAFEDLEHISIVLLAIPDQALTAMAKRLAHVKRPLVVLHVAGARTKNELAAARAAGHAIGAMHPLVSFADKKNPPTLALTTFVIAGDDDAVRVASQIASRVGARALIADVHGPAYHAAAAMVANGAAALAHAGTDLLVALGCDRIDAELALAALLRSVASNVASVGVPDALTGPVRRGDAETVAAHRAAIDVIDPSLRAVYDATGRVILRCAVDAGLDRDRAEQVLGALSKDPAKQRR